MTTAQRVAKTKGPNIRARILWELGAFICTNPAVPGDGNRHMSIAVGNGSGDAFVPSLTLATGTAFLAHEVCAGGVDLSFMNPSAMLTQAYRGVGLFREPLPVRVIWSYPSSDGCAMAIHPRFGLRTLGDVIAARPKLRVSIRQDPAHSTHILLRQLLPFYGLSSADDFEAWGCTIQRVHIPQSDVRLDALREGEIDVVIDEGVGSWFAEALAAGLVPLEFGDQAFAHLAALGWRRKSVTPERFPQLKEAYDAVDFSGWPMYGRASLPDHLVYDVCRALCARQDAIPWEKTYTGLDSVFRDGEATPLDVPFHPGALRWYEDYEREAGSH